VIKQAFRQFQYLTVPLHADLAIKEKALARTAPLDAKAGRYQPPDALVEFLESL
jgi:integrase/recombinase XerD